MTDKRSHTRINDILFGPLERPALKWLAAHMPTWVNPDILTIFGVFGALLIFISYWLTRFNHHFLWLANLGFIINWFGDSLDGTLARYRNKQRPKFGYFIDHTTDSFSEFLIIIGLGLSPYMRFDIASLILLGYFLMSIYVYVSIYVSGLFKISYGKFGPTEMRVLAMILNIVVYFVGKPMIKFTFGEVCVYDIAGGLVATVLIMIYIVSTLRDGIRLGKLGE